MHIILILLRNRYDSTAYFAKGWREALERAHCKVTVYQAHPDGHDELLTLIEKEKPTRTFSFSDVRIGGQSPSFYTGIPHFSYFLDPALYFLPHWDSECSCCDQSDVERVEAMGYPAPCFLPVGIDISPRVRPIEKQWNCVYFGSCLDVEQQEAQWLQRYGATKSQLMKEIALEVLTTPAILWDILIASSIPPHEFLTMFHEIEHWVRGEDRIRMLRSIPAAWLTIWGDGPWQRYVPNITCHPPVAFQEMRQLLPKAHFVLNSAIRFKRGLHERCLYAWDAGAIPITGTTPLWNQDFGRIGSCPFGGWEQIPSIIEYCNQDYEAHVAHGRQQCCTLHSWDHRVSTWLSYLKQGHARGSQKSTTSRESSS